LGRYDANLREIEEHFPVEILSRGTEIIIRGAPREVDRVADLLEQLRGRLRRGESLNRQEVRYAIDLARAGRLSDLDELENDMILLTGRGKRIRPKTLGQKEYIRAIREHGLVFGIGPAGTGKTYLAVAMAVAAYRNREVGRIILTRPAVEAGEHLGFLPGDLREKVNPYLRPVHDALYDILGIDTFDKYVSRGVIEVAPLAYMRGRTLDDSFVILDEAQNTTSEQMKMFLTRLGLGSKAVVTGDITQVDLPPGRGSGLQEVRAVLAGVRGIAFVYLTERDVVRHELVSRIIKAYEEHTGRCGERPAEPESEVET